MVSIKFIIGFGIVIYLIIVIFGFSLDYPANFITTTTILVLIYIIYSFSKEIDSLKKQIKQKEEEWKAVDFEERLKALKKIEKNEK